MKEIDEFPIKSYGWQELALLYNPGITPNAALRRLRNWVNHHPQLKKELENLGWKSRPSILTPLQVEIIVRHLGAP